MESSFVDSVYQKFSQERYLNKKEILFRIQPFKDDYDTLWGRILEMRKASGRKLPLVDQQGNNFWFTIPPFVDKLVHDINFVAKNKLEQIATKKVFKELMLENVMIDEAFYSSVIEGAFSTKKRTQELVREKNPKDKSERMILNSYEALVYILENINKPLNEDLFVSLHKIITDGTLEDDEKSDKYRNDQVYVSDPTKDEPIYTAPNYNEVQRMMDSLFDFINRNDQSNFIHPIIKSYIIHFYIGYVHPFFDGNGRVARAFSYMYLLKEGYDFFRFFSLSTIINKHRAKYYKSYKDTEDYGSDLTYFIAAHAEITFESITDVIDKLIREMRNEMLYDKLEKDGVELSPRQRKYIKFISKKDNNIATIEDYRKKNGIAYETARRDLNELVELGIFKKQKKGKKYIYLFIGLKGYIEEE